MPVYKVAVIGAGAAGTMAAIRAAGFGKTVALIEKNASVGRKLLLTGKGRCNLTNTASLDTFIEKFGKQGKFFRSAFSAFFNRDLMDFFKGRGLDLKVERQGRVFPVSDKSHSVVDILDKCLKGSGIETIFNVSVLGIKRREGIFRLELSSGKAIDAEKVILATGGASYKKTGSTGEGFRISERLGHTVTPLFPALVPLKTKELWVKKVQGLALKNIRLIFRYGNGKKLTSGVGELMFTHFGVSGPLVLDLSGEIVAKLKRYKEMALFIDLKPALSREQLDNRLLREFKKHTNAQIKNIMKGLLPDRLAEVFLCLTGINPEKKTNQINKEERRGIINLLKALPLTINGSLALEEAMVTAGGVSIKEIDPRTMQSKVVPGFYFAGEIIEGCAPSGGYNLQQAFSTGYLAGEAAAEDA